MISMPRASIDYADDVAPPITKGGLSMNGRRAVVWQYDPVLKRNVQADVITDAQSSEDKRGVVTVQGRSSYLAETIGLDEDESRVTVVAVPIGCKGCR